jgi:hypothetical protein
VKYISNFRLVFSKENLQPRRKVIMRWSSARHKEKISCKAWYLYQGEVCGITMPVCTAFNQFWTVSLRSILTSDTVITVCTLMCFVSVSTDMKLIKN